jgi:hypothetical protein
MLELLYLAGAVASILGAVFAWRQATNARRHATMAKEQIVRQRWIVELSGLVRQWDEVYSLLASFGPSAKLSVIRGRSTDRPARKAQDYVEAVKACRSSLSLIDHLDKRLADIASAINEFSVARSGLELKTSGTNLLSNLSDLNAAIQSALVLDREKVDLG